MRPIGIGLLGLGVVGSGVVELLRKREKELASRIGREVKLVVACDRNRERAIRLGLTKEEFTMDALSVVKNKKVDIVVELIGGTKVAYDLMDAALNEEKYVVTANKACLAERGEALFKKADRKGTGILFEAAVAGAVPVLRALRGSLAGEKLTTVYGILNGTCNYILTRLTKEGGNYQDALAEAQRLGYAEADPTLDVGGGDTAHKIQLLAMLAFGMRVPFDDIDVSGIMHLEEADLKIAKKMGRVIKLLAVAKPVGKYLDIRVHPTLIPENMPLAKIDGSMNAVMLKGPAIDEMLFAGRGAGSLPTASAVVADIAEAAGAIVGEGLPMPQLARPEKAIRSSEVLPTSRTESGFYLRFCVKDEPGIIYSVSRILTRYGISIRDVVQLDLHEFRKVTPLTFTLHPAPESKVMKALKEIQALKCMGGPTVVLRMED